MSILPTQTAVLTGGNKDGRLHKWKLARNNPWTTYRPNALMVNGGNDPASLVHVLEDGPVIEGSFARRLEIIMLPNGQVTEAIEQTKPESIHKILKKAIHYGLAK